MLKTKEYKKMNLENSKYIFSKKKMTQLFFNQNKSYTFAVQLKRKKEIIN